MAKSLSLQKVFGLLYATETFDGDRGTARNSGRETGGCRLIPV
jgi:hypothetical protein